jgi:hypothetical protein
MSDEHSSAAAGVNLLVALLVHVFVGIPMLFAVVGILSFSNGAAGAIWGLCAVGLWIAGVVRSARRHADFGAVWSVVFGSWLLAILGPIGAAYAVYAWRFAPEEPVNPEVERRLNLFAQRLAELQRELAEIRRLAEGERPAAPPAPAPQPPPPSLPKPRPAPEPQPERGPSVWDREVDFGQLLGAKGLAWAGGIVTVLGVVFFFVLAVNRGWIGPIERVGLGALASLLVFAGGLWLHRRYGPTYSAYGAVGAGLAGGYATLVAAAALYGLVSDLQALAIAAAIAAVGVATSLVWGSELVAGIGLIGATLIPMIVLFEEDLSPLGTGFAGIVFAATAIVAVSRRWPWLLAAGFVASLPQIAILVADGDATDWDRVILAALFAALYVGAAAALHWSGEDEGLPTLSATMIVFAGVIAGATGAALFDGDDRGWIIVAAAGAFGALAAAVFPRPADRDLSALLGAIALALAAVGLAIVLDGPSLAIAWAAEAAVLAWLARRIDEPRYSVAALVYLSAAAVAAVIEAPPADLYEAVADPAGGALAPLAVAVGAAFVAFYSREWTSEPRSTTGFFAFFEPLMTSFRESHRLWRGTSAWLSGIAGVYAASLGVLAATQELGDAPVVIAFERGHVLVAGLWSLFALGLVLAERRLGSVQLRTGGLLLAGATFVHAATFGVSELTGDRRGWLLLVGAAGLLAVAFADAVPVRPTEAALWPSILAVGSTGLAFFGLAQLVGDGRNEGLAWLGLAAVLGMLAALVLRVERDFATVLWTLGAMVAAIGFATVFTGNWLVLAWSATAAGLAILSALVNEERLVYGAAGYLALGLTYTLADLAAPRDFFSANTEPAAGVPSVALVVGAALVTLLFGRLPALAERLRGFAVAGVAVLAMYGLSLTILGLFQVIGTAGFETDFQRGHSAVSAMWGVIGLITLYVGLTREVRVLRLAGFALFGLALAKLFLYDLANLSSITRALSFLAVGGVLLLAGFFYQRLTNPPVREA